MQEDIQTPWEQQAQQTRVETAKTVNELLLDAKFKDGLQGFPLLLAEHNAEVINNQGELKANQIEIEGLTTDQAGENFEQKIKAKHDWRAVLLSKAKFFDAQYQVTTIKYELEQVERLDPNDFTQTDQLIEQIKIKLYQAVPQPIGPKVELAGQKQRLEEIAMLQGQLTDEISRVSSHVDSCPAPAP